VRARFQAMYDGYIREIESSGANLLGSQPTQGNIRGGLSTIEEKALGQHRQDRRPPRWWHALGAGRDAGEAGPELHGLVLGCRGSSSR